MAFLSDALARIKPSPTIAITARALRAEGGGPRHHRPQRRRARLRHARPHPRRRQGGDRPRRDALHRARGHPRAPPRDRREVRSREPARLCARAGHRLDRRQAGAVQRAPRHGEPRRRGDRPRPLLGQLSRHGGARRRHPGNRHRPARAELQDHARGARRGHHPAHQVADLQLALQPDRRRLRAGRAQGADRRARSRIRTSG